MPQSLIGTQKRELDTPILCIDLDVMESNISRMSSYMAERGKQWRPHAKCHKTPAIAHKQIAAGAIGVTVGKVSEAEVMAANGIRDILIANMIVGERKLERVVSLCREADPIVACDHYAQVEPLSAICKKHGVTCRVVIEVNIGLDRVGIRPGRDTLDLALAISKLPGLELAGLMGYEGHLLTVADQDEKRRQIADSVGILVECRELMIKNGLKCDILSAGGTGSYQITSDCPGITELQAGGGIFADPMYRNKMQVDGLDYALTVLATVVSRPTIEKAILDSGRKTLNPDHHVPLVKGFSTDEAEAVRLSAEHCELKLNGHGRDLKIGDKVELVVGYADFTTVLHDEFYGFRNDRLELVWPILGRGRLQ